MTTDKTGTLLLVLLIFSLSPASALECPLLQKVTQQGALKESRETIEQRAQLLTAQGSSAIPSLIHALRKKFPTSTDAEITDYLITKLCFGKTLGYPVDRPTATWNRYHGVRPKIDYEVWQYKSPVRRLQAGNSLLIVLPAPASVHWGTNGWNDVRDAGTKDTGLTVHVAELPVQQLSAGDTIQFTILWQESQSWEGRDYSVRVSASTEALA